MRPTRRAEQYASAQCSLSTISPILKHGRVRWHANRMKFVCVTPVPGTDDRRPPSRTLSGNQEQHQSTWPFSGVSFPFTQANHAHPLITTSVFYHTYVYPYCVSQVAVLYFRPQHHLYSSTSDWPEGTSPTRHLRCLDSESPGFGCRLGTPGEPIVPVLPQRPGRHCLRHSAAYSPRRPALGFLRSETLRL